MNESDKNTALIRNLTLFFGGFLLFTDAFFLSMKEKGLGKLKSH
jgi:hypothetical protein